MYENGKNLQEGRSDARGSVRKGYQKISNIVGQSDTEGNMIYGAGDLAISAFGLTKLFLKPDSWRLFRYVRTDYVRAYKTTPAPVLILEKTADTITIDGMPDQLGSHKQSN